MEELADLIVDDETWRAINDPVAADCVARALFVLRERIDGTPDGAAKARETIEASIEAAYLHTEAHRCALRLYLLSLTGRLRPRDEPVPLIRGAIERFEAEDGAAGKRRVRKKSGG